VPGAVASPSTGTRPATHRHRVSIEQLVLLVLITVVLAVIASLAALATAVTIRREPSEPMGAGRAPLPGDSRDGDELAERAAGPAASPDPKVARVVAFLFLVSVAVVVALTGAWPETETAIFTLLAAGTLLVLLFMDMLPDRWLGRARRPAEAIGALVFMAVLMGLTGGIQSPFFVGFFLIVAGTALSIEGWAPLAIAVAAAALFSIVAVIVSGPAATEPAALGWIVFNTVALVLLADIATAAGRAQRLAREHALRLSRFDPLTGLYNRTWLYTTLEHEIRRSSRMGRTFALLMLDLDDLKPVNDTFGHQSGDRLLKGAAEALLRTIRFTDAAARYGGDEFVVLLPETDAAGAHIVAEKLRRDIGSLSMRALDRHVRTSVSIGLVTYPEDGTAIEELIAAADVAMYEAKRRGKNQIVGYTTRTERVATALDRGAGLRTLDASVSTGDARSRAPGVPRPGDAQAARGPAEPAAPLPQHGSAGRTTVMGDAPWATRAAPGSPREALERPDQPASAAEPAVPPTRAPWIALPIDHVDETEDRAHR
jgi:diguanylate cyclase (GGDEF)-like protein